MSRKLQKGDKVIVLSGKYKGQIGEILKVLTKDEKLIVSGINKVKRHTKPSAMREGGIVEKEAPFYSCKCAIYNEKTGKADRVGFKFDEENGKKVRYYKSTGAVIESLSRG